MRGLHILPVVLLLTTSMQRVPGFPVQAATTHHLHPVVLRAVGAQKPLPGGEPILCHRKHAPGRGIDVGRIQIVMPGNAGYRVTLFRPHAGGLQWPPKHCTFFDSNAWDAIAQTTQPLLDWQLPPGVAFHFESHEPLLIRTHYLFGGGATTERRGQELTKTVLHPMERKAVTAHAGTLIAEDRTVPDPLPRGETTVASRCMMTGDGATARDLNIIGLRGQYHSKGVAFSAYRVKADGTLGELVYQAKGHDQPDLQQFSEPLVLHGGEGLEWRCSYFDPGCFVYGLGGCPQEACVLFGTYYPTETPQETITCVHDRDASGRHINIRTVTP